MPELFGKKKIGISAGAHRRSLLMHSSQCSICRHPQRAEIEQDFLDWAGPWDIARDYKLGSRTTVYRHAHALGLFARRARTLQFALGRLIEQVDEVRPTAASIVSAIRLMAKLNARDECLEEPESSEAEDAPEIAAAEAPAPAPSAKNESENDGLAVRAPVDPPAAPHAESAAIQTTTVRAKPPQSAGEDDAVEPIAFAQNAAPRRKFFWR